MAIKRILVIGGAGYIGKTLVGKLSKKYEVVLLLRNEPNKSENKFLIGDLLDKESLIQNIMGFDLVINLAAVVRSFDKKKYRENTIGLSNLIEVLERNKIKKLIYFSTINVNLKSKGHYAKSKADCEAILRESNLDYLIIRPNYVYEVGSDNNFFRLVSLIHKFNTAFVIGKGENKFQPVLRDDVVKITLELIKNYKARKTFEVCGKETVTIDDVISKIGGRFGKKPFVFRVPVWFVKLFSFLLRFDIVGADEDRIANESYAVYGKSSFNENLRKIIELVN